MRWVVTAIAAVICFSSYAYTEEGVFVKRSGDRPFEISANHANAFEDAIAKSIRKAKDSLDGAKARYEAGLPEGAKIYLTIRLMDSRGRVEQVYVRVHDWKDINNIKGHIANRLRRARGYRKGQEVTFSEADVLDWTIRYRDGREEGNYIGRFLKDWQKEQKSIK